MNSNYHLDLMSKELTAFNLTEESTLNEMAAAFSFMEDKKIELLSRIKNSPLTRKEVITKYYEHLNSYINGPDKHRELDEYRISERFFYNMLNGIIEAGTYDSIKSIYNGFYSDYIGNIEFYPEQIPPLSSLTYLAKAYSTCLVFIQLKQYFEQKAKTIPFMGENFEPNQQNKDIYRIEWKGKPEELAALMINLAEKGWINDFQKNSNGPKTAAALIKCFEIISQLTSEELASTSLKQYLKESYWQEKDAKLLHQQFGQIKENTPAKK